MIIVACKFWGHQWEGKHLLVKCDNEASATVLNSGKSKEYFMQACIRELAFVCATQCQNKRCPYSRGIQ